MPSKFRLSVHRKNEFRKKREVRRALTLPVSLPMSVYLEAPAMSLKSLLDKLTRAPDLHRGWMNTDEQVGYQGEMAVLCRVGPVEGGLVLTHQLTVTADLKWCLTVGDKKIPPESHLLQALPPTISTLSDVKAILSGVESSVPCLGIPDEKYSVLLPSRKGVFMDSAGETTVAFCDDSDVLKPTIRTSACYIICGPGSNHCLPCREYRCILNAMLHRHRKREEAGPGGGDPSSHTNYRYLSTPEKSERMKRLHQSARLYHRQVDRTKARLAAAIEERGILVDGELHGDLSQIMQDNSTKVLESYPADSFARIFWEQQLQANRQKDARSMRWEPMMIRWCLYLRHLSTGAYETLRSSGAVKLPSQRTLRDYTHFNQATSGFSSEVDRQLMDLVSIQTCPEREKYIVILMDEMHIKQNLVYNKHTGALIGYTDIGDINEHLDHFECSMDEDGSSGETLAESMLVLLVRGLLSQLKFPYAQFPCTALSGHQMLEPFWDAVCRLERCQFKVLALTCDGLAANRRLFKLHRSNSSADKSLLYKVRNPYAADKRFIFFFSDPPHLMKTVRNGWCNKIRHLWRNGKEISWGHLLALYDKCHPNTDTPGLSMNPKLKFEHIELNNFSKMRVDLAAQVLSNTVSIGLSKMGEAMEETSKFASMFDKFFDALNVSSLSMGRKKRCWFKSPYRSASDSRLSWLEKDFLSYLDMWEESVQKREGTFSTKEKEMMLLSHETREGLRITVNSFVELVRYIFTIPGVSVFLSNRLCQDPIENFFGQQRQRGRVNENPTAQQFIENTRALRVINGVCSQVRGNCRGAAKKRKGPKVDNSALPKRKIKHK